MQKSVQRRMEKTISRQNVSKFESMMPADVKPVYCEDVCLKLDYVKTPTVKEGLCISLQKDIHRAVDKVMHL